MRSDFEEKAGQRGERERTKVCANFFSRIELIKKVRAHLTFKNPYDFKAILAALFIGPKLARTEVNQRNQQNARAKSSTGRKRIAITLFIISFFCFRRPMLRPRGEDKRTSNAGLSEADAAEKAEDHVSKGSGNAGNGSGGSRSSSGDGRALSWPTRTELEYIEQKEQAADQLVVLNVGGTKYEVIKMQIANEPRLFGTRDLHAYGLFSPDSSSSIESSFCTCKRREVSTSMLSFKHWFTWYPTFVLFDVLTRHAMPCLFGFPFEANT